MDNKDKKWWRIILNHKILAAIICGIAVICAALIAITPFLWEKLRPEPPKFVIAHPIIQPDVGLTIKLPNNDTLNNDYLDIEIDGILFPKSAKYITGSNPHCYHFNINDKNITDLMLHNVEHKVRIRFPGKLFSEPITIIVKNNILLRSNCKVLSVSELQSMPNIYFRHNRDRGFEGHSTIIHKYDSEIINSDTVTIDRYTDLMWHQSGSDDKMKWGEVKQWVNELNISGYAGYNDWRLPTVEEAASLIESSRMNENLSIDSAFEIKQWCIWTCDRPGYSFHAWRVAFSNGGYVDMIHIGKNSAFIRPVRSSK